MSHQALLDAVLADPDADTPRLVYADWFEENGDPDRATLIRSQCELNRLPTWSARAAVLRHVVRVLLARHGERWARHLPQVDGVRLTRFDRGFPNAVLLDSPQRLLDLAPLRALVPLDSVDLAVDEEGALPPGDHGWVRRFELSGAYAFEADHLDTLLDSSIVEGLRYLSLAQAGIENEGAVRLARSGIVKQLDTLDLTNCFVGAEGFTQLVDAGLGRIRSIGMGSYGSGYVADPFVTDAALAHLAEVGSDTLQELFLDGSLVGTEGIRALLGSQRLPALESLSLRYCEVTGEAFESGPARLRSLDLEGTSFGDVDTGGFTTLARIEQLRLPGAHAGRTTLGSLANGPMAKTLQVLHVAHCQLDAEAVDALAAGSWDALHTLVLRGNRFGQEAGPALGRARFPALRHVDLCETDLGEGVRALANAAWLPGLTRLELGETGVQGEALATLPLPRGATHVNVRRNPLGPAGMRWLAQLDPSVLTDLDVSATAPGEDGLAALGSREWPALLKLELFNLEAGFAALEGLLRRLPRVEILDLQMNPIEAPRAVDVLAAMPALRDLRITRCGFDDDAMLAVLDGPLGEQLVSLEAWGNKCSPEVWRRVQDFGRSWGPSRFDEDVADPGI
ncbi:MAG: TIGR02996 domain-containing protein [Alphaproteobacteria bacterium]|nr:TIGR02996 domain-containing protein [Alphaproteobacteria bacterium]